MKTALITGITGQDGSYLAELLLEKGYRVFGVVRRLSTPNFTRIEGIKDRVTLFDADLADPLSLVQAIKKSNPDEVYNLAAQSFVATSWEQAILTGHYTALGVTNILEAIRSVNPKIKYYQASSSEMYGKVLDTPQKEKTPFYPRSPYGVAKVYGHHLTVNYRESYGMFCVSGILFNHESPRRGIEFVTRKIANAAARIKFGLQDSLYLGNLDAKRDWGYAKDFVEAMWLMLQQDVADDYVISTGECHTVEEYCRIAFEHLDLNYKNYVKVDERFLRPAEVDLLLGDSSKAYKNLGWKAKTSFPDLVKLMVDSEVEACQKIISLTKAR